MKFTPLAASLFALALFSAPLLAEDAPVVKDQPTSPAAEVAAPQISQEILDFLADTRSVTELSVDELVSRAKLARQYSKADGLPAEMQDQLKGISQSAKAEIANREAAAQAAQPAVEAPAPVVEQPVEAAPAPVVEQPAEAAPAAPVAEQPVEAAPAAPIVAELPPEVTALLSDTRPASELTTEELDARARQARKFAKIDGIPQDVADQLKALAGAAHDEFVARQDKAKQEEQHAQPAPAEVPADAPAPVAPVEAAVPPPPPAIIEVAPTAPLPPPPAAVVEVPAEPALAPAAAPVVVDKGQAQKLDGNTGDPEAEAKAKVFLDDPRPAEKLNDEELRARLDGIRELMAGNELSRDTERALRQKLKAERDILRNRVAVAEAAPPAQAAAPQPGAPPPPPPSTARPPRAHKNGINLSFEIVLNDRRPSDELEDYELRRRLEVYRQATYDQRYEEQQRAYWRAVMDRDQYLLQQRLLRERRARQAELQAQYEAGQYAVELDDSEYGSEDDDEDIYAAEVDDAELQRVLIAPPRKKITRRYTVKEVEASPTLRASLPRVEIDTVHFGFNEAFVRAEEVSNLDRLAEIMERILTAHPREVFLIEGHTDAVGSDAANLALSRQRAEAIKKALQTYYVIPAKNLKTVGYGERYLKIPTAEAEQENRRVSVSRATALIGQAEE